MATTFIAFFKISRNGKGDPFLISGGVLGWESDVPFFSRDLRKTVGRVNFLAVSTISIERSTDFISIMRIE